MFKLNQLALMTFLLVRRVVC